MTSVHFLNGEFVTEDKLRISPRDLGFSRGYAVFDFLKTYPHQRPFKLKEHIDRLFNSAKEINLDIPWRKSQMTSWVLETLKKNPGGEKFIKIYVSGGISNSMLPGEKSSIIILVDSATVYPQDWYEKGTGVVTAKHDRYNMGAKTNNYIEGVKQTALAKKIGALEPIYYSEKQVYEGSNSNVFALIKGKLLTPKTNLLPGITRGVLLKILKLGVPICEQNFTLRQLRDAREVFMTGSGKEVVPVVRIDGKKVGDGNVGPVTKEVMQQFREYTLSSK